MNTNFHDLPWHDANLQFIYIDRENPGERDVIKLLIDWPDGNSTFIEFYNCYGLNMNMNFGIIACESILSAECFLDSIELDAIRKIWAEMGATLENLKHYKIITNTTNSSINIFALDFQIIKSLP